MPYPYERPPPARLRRFHQDPAQPAINEIIARSAKEQRKNLQALGVVQLPRPVVLVATSPTNSGHVSRSLLKAAFQAIGTPPIWTHRWAILIDDQYFELQRYPRTSRFHFVQSTWGQSKIEETIAWSEVIGYSDLTNKDILDIGSICAQRLGETYNAFFNNCQDLICAVLQHILSNGFENFHMRRRFHALKAVQIGIRLVDYRSPILDMSPSNGGLRVNNNLISWRTTSPVTKRTQPSATVATHTNTIFPNWHSIFTTGALKRPRIVSPQITYPFDDLEDSDSTSESEVDLFAGTSTPNSNLTLHVTPQ